VNRRTVWTLAGAGLIVAFIAFGAGAFKSSLTPYVSFDVARSSGNAVQVAGRLLPDSTHFDQERGALAFTLVNEAGDTLAVTYKGMKPGNFEEATQIVAIGRFNGSALEAERLLVKCPSKYQGVEEKEYGSSSS
jgi:cytochrome c-type biogenesis protein CcmE